MPLGFERLNERTKRPNDHVNFIRPLPGKDEDLSRDFLERIAAICYPIMKANHIYVMALEEHEPNQEFIGRNFNAGEVVQLVLRAPFTGQWMPFKHVQMVMMHELAHCKQMNHSKFFWKVRDQYAAELRELWGKKYSGEGLWGRGQTLLSGQYETDIMPEAVQNIDRLCGGTYRSGGRKRKRGKAKPQLSYAERKQRRILKKFGTGGVALGDDDGTRMQLESGKKTKGKPRVAGSARGRELRAAAALARFEQVKNEEDGEVNIKEEEMTDSETEDEDEGYATAEQAVDTDGKKMTDSKGRPLISVCGAEDPADDDVQREMRELFNYDYTKKQLLPANSTVKAAQYESVIREEDVSTASEDEDDTPTRERISRALPGPSKAKGTAQGATVPSEPPEIPHEPDPASTPSAREDSSALTCEVCSLENTLDALICAACSHVLRPDAILNTWRCQSSSCKNSVYLSSDDVGRCGICGALKP